MFDLSFAPPPTHDCLPPLEVECPLVEVVGQSLSHLILANLGGPSCKYSKFVMARPPWL